MPGQRLSEDMRALGRMTQSQRSKTLAADLRPIIGELKAPKASPRSEASPRRGTGRGIPTARGGKQWSAIGSKSRRAFGVATFDSAAWGTFSGVCVRTKGLYHNGRRTRQ